MSPRCTANRDNQLMLPLRLLNTSIVRTLEKERAEGRESIAHWTYVSARNKILAERHGGTDARDGAEDQIGFT